MEIIAMNRGRFFLLKPRRDPAAAFSLLELLAVIAIVAILAGLAIPGLISLTQSSELSQAGQSVADQLNLARQTALARNRNVVFRLYHVDSAQPYWGIQTSERAPDGSEKALSRIVPLPHSILIETNSGFTTLLGAETQATNLAAPAGLANQTISAAYGFEFSASGGTTLTNQTGNYFLTLRHLTDPPRGNDPPRNFFCIQVDPANGRFRIYRP